MEFDQIPSDIRVKLTEEDRKTLWEEIEDLTVKQASEETGFSTSKIYNWKNKDSFLPIEFVKHFLKNIEEVNALKGGGRSQPIHNLEFPIKLNEELQTRVNCSVTVNKEGVPVYQTDDRGNAARFTQLLNSYNLPYRVYNRDFYEIRYPKYFHQILDKQSFEEDFAAKVDEKGYVENGYVGTENEKVEIADFNSELFSRSKRLALALERENSEEITKLMAEESEEIQRLLQS